MLDRRGIVRGASAAEEHPVRRGRGPRRPTPGAHAAACLARVRRMGFDRRVNAFIDDLIARYPRRRAMKEELDRVRPR